jgi:hypothetical protein
VAAGVVAAEAVPLLLPCLDITTCQICLKTGHSATTSWYRFDQSSRRDSNPMAAFMASSTPDLDYQWYHDTGSNVHITNELANLNVNVDEYIGPDQVRVGNGQGLQILHTGSSLLYPMGCYLIWLASPPLEPYGLPWRNYFPPNLRLMFMFSACLTIGQSILIYNEIMHSYQQ